MHISGPLFLIMDMPYLVYVLWSASHQLFYIGVTDNISRRIEQHNAGISKWTCGKGPWELVWQRPFPNLSEARKFENQLKRQKGGDKFFEYTALDKSKFISSGS